MPTEPDRPTREWVEALLADATPAPWRWDPPVDGLRCTIMSGPVVPVAFDVRSDDAPLIAAAPALAAELVRVMAAEKVAVDAVEGLLDLAARMRTERNEARRHHREHCSLAEKAIAERDRLRDILKRLVDADYGSEVAPDHAIASACLEQYRQAITDARAALDGEERHGE